MHPYLYFILSQIAVIVLFHFALQVWLWKLRDMEKRLHKATLDLQIQRDAVKRTNQVLFEQMLEAEQRFMEARRAAYRADHPLRRRSDRKFTEVED